MRRAAARPSARRARAGRRRRRASRELQRAVEDVYVDELLLRWIVELVRATRDVEGVALGASVRGSLALERTARAWALLHGRDHVVPEDVERLFLPVLGHRLLLTPSFLAETRALGRDEALERDQGALPRARAAARARTGTTPATAAERDAGERAADLPARPAPAPRRAAVRRRCRAAAAAAAATSIGTRAVRRRRPGLDDRLVRVGAALGGARRATSSSCASAPPTRRRASCSSATAGPRWALYPRRSRGSSKPRALRRGGDAIVASAVAARARRRRRSTSRGRATSRTGCRPAGATGRGSSPSARRRRRSTAPEDTLERALAFLGSAAQRPAAGHASSSSSPTSSSPPPASAWLRGGRARLGRRPGRRPGSGLGAELPAVGGVAVPFADPRDRTRRARAPDAPRRPTSGAPRTRQRLRRAARRARVARARPGRARHERPARRSTARSSPGPSVRRQRRWAR